MLRTHHLLLAGLLAAAPSAPTIAAENWDLCRVPVPLPVEAVTSSAGDTAVEADSVSSDDSERILFLGNVELNRGQQYIRADELQLDKRAGSLRASGNVVFQDSQYRLQSPRISIDQPRDRASFERPEFELYSRHARGSAERMERLDPERSRFVDLFYTSCDPDDRVWHLRAQEMNLDYASGRGTARHTRLYLQDVPFMYLPWFQFPVDDRRLSGLLAPRFGYSEDNGRELELPVYWNMAPNYDMTITPAWYEERGGQLNTENRYLFRRDHGQLDLSWIDDRSFDDTRWFQQWQHQSRPGLGTVADLRLADVSDGEYFDDFGSVAPQYNDISHLERYVSLARPGDFWEAELLWQDYKTLDEDTATEDRPYDRLPRLGLRGEFRSRPAALRAPLELEWVNFERDDSVTGERSHVTGSLIWRAEQSWYFVEPELLLAATDYRLDDNNLGDDRIDRAIPTFAIDSGLIFDRRTGPENRWRQTLEPRLYLLHTPYEQQDDIPDFDTSLLVSTYDNLFRNNRFSGADRIGDATQVTMGLASRLFDDSNGRELLLARAGQIYYFKDRRVSLDGSRDEANRSDLIAELDIWPNERTRVASRFVYDEDTDDIDERDLSVNYADAGFAANIGYFFTDDELEQVVLSLAYPVDERWTLFAKYHQSLLFEKPVDHLLGLAYESCCWGIKILAGQSGDEDDDFGDTDNQVSIEITLKGLSDAGTDIDARLSEAIPGYQARF